MHNGIGGCHRGSEEAESLAKAEVLESEAFGLSEQQITFAKERHRYYSTLLNRLESEPLEDVISS